jgi:hypothetical protein
MKQSKQAQELAQTIDQLNAYYDDLVLYLDLLQDKPNLRGELMKVLDKAKAWDIFRAKCAKGAKVASGNLSRKERIDRARKASHAKSIKAEKEKARKELNRIKRGKTRTKTEQSA